MVNQPNIDTFHFPRLESLDNQPVTPPTNASAELDKARTEIEALRAQLSVVSNPGAANPNSVTLHCPVCGNAIEAVVPNPADKGTFVSADSVRAYLPCGHYSTEYFSPDNLPTGKGLNS